VDFGFDLQIFNVAALAQGLVLYCSGLSPPHLAIARRWVILSEIDVSFSGVPRGPLRKFLALCVNDSLGYLPNDRVRLRFSCSYHILHITRYGDHFRMMSLALNSFFRNSL
jgi:hypothetical protein